MSSTICSRSCRTATAVTTRSAASGSSEQALSELRELAESGEEVALVLAAQWLSGMTGSELLG